MMDANSIDKLALETVEAIFSDIKDREKQSGGHTMMALRFGHPAQIKAQWQLIIADALRRASTDTKGGD